MPKPGVVLLAVLAAMLPLHDAWSATAPPPPALGKELQAFLNKSEAEMDLGAGALLIAREEYPALDANAQLKALDALGERLAAALTRGGTVREKLEALRAFLFDEEKFALPKKDDATAFLLSDVLKNKRGNCLGLAVLALALAERAGWSAKLHGVPVPSRLSGPGHLLLRYDDGATRLNFDPTENGAAHPDEHYRELFKLRPEDLKDGYILGNAKRKDVLNLLLVNLGGARVEAGRAAEALPLLAAATALKPGYAPAHMNLGAARLKLGDLAAAESAYRRAAELDAGLVGARLGLAELALRRGDTAQAEKEARAVETAEPENVQARSLLANVFLARKEYPAARAALAEIVQKSPDDLLARCNLGTACYVMGEFAEAEAIFRQALAQDAKCAQAHYGLAETLRAFGRGEEAQGEFNAALTCDPLHIPSRLALGQDQQLAGNFAAAEASFREILRIQPFHLQTLRALAQTLISQKKSQAADEVLNSALKAHPESLEIATLASEVKLSTGDFRGALAAFQTLLAKAEEAEKPRFWERIAVCHGKLGDHKRAYETAQEILKVNPNDVPALRICAAACEGLRNASKAIEFYKKILALAPDDPGAQKALARLGAK